MNEGIKKDEGKTRYDLISAIALEWLGKVYTWGANNKYADHNWRKGLAWSRVFAAIMRHLWAFWRGEEIDPESGLPHMAHAAWNCFALLEYMETRREFDDRYKEIPFNFTKVQEEARQRVEEYHSGIKINPKDIEFNGYSNKFEAEHGGRKATEKMLKDDLCCKEKKGKVMCFDMDGTIAEGTAWTPAACLDAMTNDEMVERVNKAYEKNFVIIYTARRDDMIPATIEWLRRNNVRYHAISNIKIPADVYIDDKMERV